MKPYVKSYNCSRSTSRCLLEAPRTNLKHGDGSFSFAAATEWNSGNKAGRDSQGVQTKVKSYLFNIYFRQPFWTATSYNFFIIYIFAVVVCGPIVCFVYVMSFYVSPLNFLGFLDLK